MDDDNKGADMPSPAELAKPPEDPVEAAEEVAAKRNGHLPIGTVEQILEVAKTDIRTKLIDVDEWGFAVRIKTLTAAQRASIRSAGVRAGGDAVAWGEMEIQQFLLAVIEPEFTEADVRRLHSESGPGFVRVIEEHDELSSMSKEELRDLRNAFPAGGADPV